jgi:hypothetical protein
MIVVLSILPVRQEHQLFLFFELLAPEKKCSAHLSMRNQRGDCFRTNL